MSEEFSLRELRERATGGVSEIYVFTDAEGLALVEAVEAAQAISDSLVDPDPEEARLLAALARFKDYA